MITDYITPHNLTLESRRYHDVLNAVDALAPFAAHYQRIIREDDIRPLKVVVPFDWLERAAYYYSKAKGEIE